MQSATAETCNAKELQRQVTIEMHNENIEKQGLEELFQADRDGRGQPGGASSTSRTEMLLMTSEDGGASIEESQDHEMVWDSQVSDDLGEESEKGREEEKV